jgi:hypothetical protein
MYGPNPDDPRNANAVLQPAGSMDIAGLGKRGSTTADRERITTVFGAPHDTRNGRVWWAAFLPNGQPVGINNYPDRRASKGTRNDETYTIIALDPEDAAEARRLLEDE